jgi:hypothetical protein
MTDRWSIRLAGAVDQAALDALRAALDLAPRGRLGDDYDELFGRGDTDIDGRPVRLSLWRDVTMTDVTWRIGVESDSTLSDQQANAIAARVDAAARSARTLFVASVFHRPPSEGDNE